MVNWYVDQRPFLASAQQTQQRKTEPTLFFLFTAAGSWVEAARFLSGMVQIRGAQERGKFTFGGADDSGVGDNAVLKTRLIP